MGGRRPAFNTRSKPESAAHGGVERISCPPGDAKGESPREFPDHMSTASRAVGRARTTEQLADGRVTWWVELRRRDQSPSSIALLAPCIGLCALRIGAPTGE